MFWQKRLTNAKQLNKYNADDSDDETKVRVGDRGRKKEAKKIKIKIKKKHTKNGKRAHNFNVTKNEVPFYCGTFTKYVRVHVHVQRFFFR